MKRDSQDGHPDHLNEWLGFWKFFLGTFILGVATFFVNKDIQNREVEIKEQEHIGKYLEHAIEEDVGIRLRFAQYFSNVSRSEVLRKRWNDYLKIIQKEYDVKEAQLKELIAKSKEEEITGQEKEALLAKIDSFEKALNPEQNERVIRLPSRVYIHVRNGEDKSKAQGVAATLQDNGFSVPGIQVLSQGPGRSEFRYFRKREKEFAQAAFALLPAEIGAKLVYVPGYESSNLIRDRHFELWLGEGVLD